MKMKMARNSDDEKKTSDGIQTQSLTSGKSEETEMSFLTTFTVNILCALYKSAK